MLASRQRVRYNNSVTTRSRTAGKRALPSIHRLLETSEVAEALQSIPRPLLVEALRAEIEEVRRRLSESDAPPPEAVLVERALRRAWRAAQPSLQRAINATGVILHTGLGRATLSGAAQRAVAEVAAGHSTLEIDLQTGRRGCRQEHVRPLLCELTEAESALVVNNNAGAVLLAVTALAAGREVILSRGELVEIGGAFRMPDIIRASGATLVEVGTTNRTRLSDYAGAITERTGLILRCHPSNFKIVGFTEEVPASELAKLGQERGVPVMDDLGSGALIDTARFGAGPTTTLRAAVASGCDIVTASGDKLLGGPQAGLILGRKPLVEQIARHPMARALRVDKLTLAALEATLRLYREPERAIREIPTLRYLARTRQQLEDMAERLRQQIATTVADVLTAELVPEQSQVGGGSLPGEDLPTVCVRLRPTDENISVEEIAARLRRNRPAVFVRIREEAILLDPRTMEEKEFAEVAAAVQAAFRENGKP